MRRLHEVQSKSLDESYRNEDANDDAILTEIERSSRSSSKINVNETGSPVRTSPRIGDTSDFVARSVNRGVSKEDLSPLEKVSPQVLSQQSADKSSSHRNGVDYSQRSYSETNIGENSTRKGTYSGIDKSERSHSEGDVLEISNNDNNLTNHAMITRVPGKIEERLTESSSNFDRTDFNEKSPLQQDFQGLFAAPLNVFLLALFLRSHLFAVFNNLILARKVCVKIIPWRGNLTKLVIIKINVQIGMTKSIVEFMQGFGYKLIMLFENRFPQFISWSICFRWVFCQHIF